jgi:hypothetical protein
MAACKVRLAGGDGEAGSEKAEALKGEKGLNTRKTVGRSENPKAELRNDQPE